MAESGEYTRDNCDVKISFGGGDEFIITGWMEPSDKVAGRLVFDFEVDSEEYYILMDKLKLK